MLEESNLVLLDWLVEWAIVFFIPQALHEGFELLLATLMCPDQISQRWICDVVCV